MRSDLRNQLAETYSTWESERIAKTIALDASDYETEALDMMRQTLLSRGFGDDYVANFRLPPPLPSSRPTRKKEGLFPHTLRRSSYFLRNIGFIILFLVFGSALLDREYGAVGTVLGLIPFLALFAYSTWWMYVPRIRSIGWPIWSVLIMLIPIANVVFSVILMIVPEKQSSQSPQTRSTSGPV